CAYCRGAGAWWWGAASRAPWTGIGIRASAAAARNTAARRRHGLDRLRGARRSEAIVTDLPFSGIWIRNWTSRHHDIKTSNV
ncbi:hypothetical protein AB0H03_40200, partial [Streptomyces sparsogenes]|uniref:hypothetical protein n=1 Tax=Streptomyces sparsogenes TaxID=67365 RepID=UPI0033C54C90